MSENPLNFDDQQIDSQEMMSITPEWSEGVAKIEYEVKQACIRAGHKVCRIVCSTWHEDDRGVPINNLREIAYPGKVILVVKANDYFGGPKSKTYLSDLLVNPTWLDVCVCANDSIKCTRDKYHIFVEMLRPTGEMVDGVPVMTICLGS